MAPLVTFPPSPTIVAERTLTIPEYAALGEYQQAIYGLARLRGADDDALRDHTLLNQAARALITAPHAISLGTGTKQDQRGSQWFATLLGEAMAAILEISGRHDLDLEGAISELHRAKLRAAGQPLGRSVHHG